MVSSDGHLVLQWTPDLRSAGNTVVQPFQRSLTICRQPSVMHRLSLEVEDSRRAAVNGVRERT